MKRLGNTACELFIAWPVVTAVWVLDKAAGRVVDARACRWANETHEDAPSIFWADLAANLRAPEFAAAFNEARASVTGSDAEEDERDVQTALRAADAGDAGHWPTVAGVLADEVRRLRAERGVE